VSTTLLDAITAATADTVPAFSVSSAADRRAFALVIHTHGSNAAPCTALDWGGEAGEVLATIDDNANTFDICATLFCWTEAQIAARASDTLTPTGGTYTNRQYVTWSTQDATQDALTPATSATSGTSGSISAVRVADSYTVAFAMHDFTGVAFTGLAEPSEAGEFSFNNGDIAYGNAADTARTASFTWTHSTSRNNVSFVLNIPPAATPAGHGALLAQHRNRLVFS